MTGTKSHGSRDSVLIGRGLIAALLPISILYEVRMHEDYFYPTKTTSTVL